MRNILQELQEQYNQALRIHDSILSAVDKKEYGEARFLLKGLEMVKKDMESTLKRKEI